MKQNFGCFAPHLDLPATDRVTLASGVGRCERSVRADVFAGARGR